MSGLQARLSRSFLLVAFTVVSLTAGLILVTGSGLFTRYLTSTVTLRHQRLIWVIEQSYAAAGGWQGLQGYGGRYFGMTAGTGMIVRDQSGEVVFASGRYSDLYPGVEPVPGQPGPGMSGWGRRGMGPRGGGMMGPGGMHWTDQARVPPEREWRKALRVTRSTALYPLESGGRRIGTVAFDLPASANALGTLEGNFRRLVGLAALAAALMAGVFGWASGALIARRLARPIVALRDAARRFAAGQLSARVSLLEGEGDPPDEIRELGRSFNLMAERLEQLEQVRRQLTADVAHELRTPVTAAKSLVEAFRDGVLPPDEANLSQLDGELARLGRLVGDLRDLSVAESGKLQLSRDRLDLREVLDSVVEAWRPRFSEAGLTLDFAPDDVPLAVVGDASALERVFNNILANALKYTPTGGQAQVTASRDGAAAVVAVRDTGEGVPPDELPLVFERFFRGKARRAGQEGTGVGLAIVKEIVEAHRGEVTLDSRLGEGTTVTVRLPLA